MAQHAAATQALSLGALDDVAALLCVDADSRSQTDCRKGEQKAAFATMHALLSTLELFFRLERLQRSTLFAALCNLVNGGMASRLVPLLQHDLADVSNGAAVVLMVVGRVISLSRHTSARGCSALAVALTTPAAVTSLLVQAGGAFAPSDSRGENAALSNLLQLAQFDAPALAASLDSPAVLPGAGIALLVGIACYKSPTGSHERQSVSAATQLLHAYCVGAAAAAAAPFPLVEYRTALLPALVSSATRGRSAAQPAAALLHLIFRACAAGPPGSIESLEADCTGLALPELTELCRASAASASAVAQSPPSAPPPPCLSAAASLALLPRVSRVVKGLLLGHALGGRAACGSVRLLPHGAAGVAFDAAAPATPLDLERMELAWRKVRRGVMRAAIATSLRREEAAHFVHLLTRSSADARRLSQPRRARRRRR